MEELLVFLIQGAFELLAGIFEGAGEILWSAANWGFASDVLELIVRTFGYLIGCFSEAAPAMSESTQAGWISVVYFLAGLLLGAISLGLHHDVLLRRSSHRLLALGLGPLFSGAVSWLNAKLSIFFRTRVRPAYCFSWALFFALGLSVVRFGFCHRVIT